VLNGSSEYANVGDDDAYSFGDSSIDSPFTMAAWINMVDATKFRIFGKYTAVSDREYYFHTSGADDLQIALHDDSGSIFQALTTDSSITSHENTWIHVAATYDGRGGTSAANGLALYINGIAVAATTSSGGSYLAMSNTSTPLLVGAWAGAAPTTANGAIAAPLIWNRALSAAEVAGLYNETVAVTNDGTSVELPRRWIGSTNSVVLDLDVGEEWDSGDTVTNGTLMVNHGSAGGTATVVGTPDVSGAVKVPPTNR